MNLSINDIDNLLWSFQKHVPEDKLGHKTKVQLLKIALMQEMNLPSTQMEAPKDPFSVKWHDLFETNTTKLKSIFGNLGVTEEQIEEILKEYGKVTHQSIWRRA
ncbi:hypothetical protein AD998_12385 [bacterium 336/3]|jgi:hypothetical protein|nr:hypothetical protein AD998_12385 [bacterium 336/3]